MYHRFNYIGIITKVKAMEVNFIQEEDYEKISHFDSVSDFITFLKKHPGYHAIFYNQDEHMLHRGQTESLLIYALYQDFYRLYRFAAIPQRRNLEFIFFRFEINILKDCIQIVYRKKGSYYLSSFDTFFRKHSKINIDALTASASMEEYINNLKGTEFYTVLVSLQNKSNLTPFDYEMQLDIYYYKRSWKLKDKLLSQDTLKAMTCSLGTEIDLLNILWLYRFKKYYDFRTANLYANIIPVNYRLSKEQLAKLILSESVEEFFILLGNTYYKKLLPKLKNDTLEYSCRQFLTKTYKDISSEYPVSMAPINHYFNRKITEIGRLTTALECIRYKIGPQESLQYILQT
jgi:V/A-type H+-transporting ATPase subunit C